MDKEEHNCDNVNCNHNDTNGLCCLFNPDNCKYRQLQKENAELKEQNRKLLESCEGATMMYEHLTKAKDILRRLIENQPTPSSMYEEADLVGWREVNKEAEQFLKNDSCPDVMCEDCTKEDCGIKKLGLVEVKK